jgi:hypothetical protein
LSACWRRYGLVVPASRLGMNANPVSGTGFAQDTRPIDEA